MEAKVTAWFRSDEGRAKWDKDRHKVWSFIGLGTVGGPGFRDIARWCGVDHSKAFEEWLIGELMSHYTKLYDRDGTSGVSSVDRVIKAKKEGLLGPNRAHWGIQWFLLVGKEYIQGLNRRSMDTLFIHFAAGAASE